MSFICCPAVLHLYLVKNAWLSPRGRKYSPAVVEVFTTSKNKQTLDKSIWLFSSPVITNFKYLLPLEELKMFPGTLDIFITIIFMAF